MGCRGRQDVVFRSCYDLDWVGLQQARTECQADTQREKRENASEINISIALIAGVCLFRGAPDNTSKIEIDPSPTKAELNDAAPISDMKNAGEIDLSGPLLRLLKHCARVSAEIKMLFKTLLRFLIP